jgi:TolA-binding protein
MKPATGLLGFVALLALTACGGGSSSSAVAVPADYSSLVSAISSAVSQENSDLSHETSAASSGPADSAGPCANLQDNVDYDVTTNIGRDTQDVTYDVTNLQNAISQMQTDIANMHTDVTAIANEGTPIPADINAFVSSANSQVLQAIASANSQIDQANSLTSNAYNTANALATGSCSGKGPGSTPAPIGHIT